jgi:hypothetical protein
MWKFGLGQRVLRVVKVSGYHSLAIERLLGQEKEHSPGDC